MTLAPLPRMLSRVGTGFLGTALLATAARRNGTLNRIDAHLVLPAAEAPSARRAWLAVTALGSRPLAYSAVAARCLLSRNSEPWTVRFQPLLVLASSDAVRTGLCYLIRRPRPPAADRLAATHGPSFPSRHTSTALIACHLAFAPRGRHTGNGVAEAVAAVVGVSRLTLRVHWPTDVAGGWLFGYGWSAAADLAYAAVGACPHRASGPGRVGTGR
ncbi:phosphatase PAP2 family protein [Streptomyces sp. NPDC057697]|uniref:phosphatase PAP2 family protein n=1 Tax=Streptomyces sp. NPDC057697 TaxID=3346219 RepID=UPI0036C82FC2